MYTHKSNYGVFGAHLPCDSQGFVKYNQRHFSMLIQGKTPRNASKATLAIAAAALALAAWRGE
jgi:hypothetical protein